MHNSINSAKPRTSFKSKMVMGIGVDQSHVILSSNPLFDHLINSTLG